MQNEVSIIALKNFTFSSKTKTPSTTVYSSQTVVSCTAAKRTFYASHFHWSNLEIFRAQFFLWKIPNKNTFSDPESFTPLINKHEYSFLLYMKVWRKRNNFLVRAKRATLNTGVCFAKFILQTRGVVVVVVACSQFFCSLLLKACILENIIIRVIAGGALNRNSIFLA